MKKGLLIMGLLSLLASLTGCHKADFFSGEEGTEGAGKKAVVNQSGMVYFQYSYSNPFGMCGYEYTVCKEEDGSVTFTYSEDEHLDYGEMSMQVDESLLDQLNTIYIDQNLAAWDGYHKYNKNVCDGDGFGVRFRFADQVSQGASGSNCVPDGYRNFVDTITPLFKPYISTLLDEAKQRKIEAGVSGIPNCMMINIKQNGNSGHDSYEFLLRASDIVNNNFEVRIKSISGEFFPEGEYRYYCAMPDEAIWFERVNELVQKYQLVSWMDWNLAAEDYNNAEWFQLDLDYEDGTISAYGTAHPENYDEFRSEFLQLMAEMIQYDEENFGLKQYE